MLAALAATGSGLALQRVEPLSLPLSAYHSLIDESLRAEIERLAAPLRGLRVVHINATPYGGGVAEILWALVPLSRDVGLDAQWYVLPPDDEFFQVTKCLHNYLQGQPGRLSPRQRQVYTRYLRRVAASMRHLRADVWVVHDPQPLALRELVPLQGKTIWRCHIDSSTPNQSALQFLMPWIRSYDLAVFSLPSYTPPGLRPQQVVTVAPAIDPLSPKNQPLDLAGACDILARLGLDPQRPLICQVSRFDPWKNPWQAVEAYRLAKAELPHLQLALVGVFSAKDDPEAPVIYQSVKQYANGDPDIYLFTDASLVGAREVNAFQSAASVVLQRSLREGFGLVVTEAMWKGRPVIGTAVGGIQLQIRDRENGFLASTAEECAKRIIHLVTDQPTASAIGRAARETVRAHFLLPRLLRDDLRLYGQLVQALAA